MAERNQASLLLLPSAVTTRKLGSASNGAERGEQHLGSHRQGHGQGRKDNSKAGVQQSPAQKGNRERQRHADLWKQADRRSTFAAAPPVATLQGRASGRGVGVRPGMARGVRPCLGPPSQPSPTRGEGAILDRYQCSKGDVYLRETEPAPASS